MKTCWTCAGSGEVCAYCGEAEQNCFCQDRMSAYAVCPKCNGEGDVAESAVEFLANNRGEGGRDDG